GEVAVGAVHVVPGPAVAAEPAGGQGMEDHGVAGGDVADGGAEVVDPAGVLVAEGVGQRRVGVQLVPLAEVEVDVGPAHAGPTDLDDHVEGALDLGLLDVVNRWPHVVLVEPHCLHPRLTSSPATGCLTLRSFDTSLNRTSSQTFTMVGNQDALALALSWAIYDSTGAAAAGRDRRRAAAPSLLPGVWAGGGNLGFTG